MNALTVHEAEELLITMGAFAVELEHETHERDWFSKAEIITDLNFNPKFIKSPIRETQKRVQDRLLQFILHLSEVLNKVSSTC